MIVSHQGQLIFLKTVKTAGTSVEIALSRVCGPDDTITPISPEDEKLRISLGGRGPQLYASPPLRAKAFNHMPARRVRRAVGLEVWNSYFKFAIERNPWDLVVSLYFWRFRNVGAPMRFDEYVAGPAVEKLAETNAKVYRIRGEIVADRICRYESLGADLAEVWAERGLPGSPELPHAKANSRPERTSYRTLYSTASRDRVETVFAAVISDLGFEF